MLFTFQQGQTGRRCSAGGGSGGGGSDPFFSDVLLLNNHQGSNGSTTFTDASPVGRALTPTGNAQISTAQFIFGTSSAYFDGTGDAVDCGTGTDIANIPPTQDWCEEFWMRPDDASYTGGITALQGLICILQSGGDDRVVTTQYYSAAGASRRPSGGAQNNGTELRGAHNFSAATWYFVQMVNDADANTFKVQIGGVEYISTTRKGRYYRYYGAGGTPGLDYYKGYIGPVRLTAAARPFAVPTGLFPEA